MTRFGNRIVARIGLIAFWIGRRIMFAGLRTIGLRGSPDEINRSAYSAVEQMRPLTAAVDLVLGELERRRLAAAVPSGGMDFEYRPNNLRRFDS